LVGLVTKKNERLIREDIPIKENPAGDSFGITLYHLEGEAPGPHVHIQSSVHGAEIQGNAVIFQLIDYLLNNPFKGSFTFIPCANPMAINQKIGTQTFGRFNANSGDNWNRNYLDLLTLNTDMTGLDLDAFIDRHQGHSQEEMNKNFKAQINDSLKSSFDFYSQRGISENKKLNIILQKLASKADIVLDLHTGPKAIRYLYIGEFEKEKAKDLCFPFNLIIPNEFDGAMDEACFMPWVGLKKKMDERSLPFEIPFESYTVELGSEEDLSFEEAKNDAHKLLHLFSKRNILEKSPPFTKEKQTYSLLKDYQTYYMPMGGLVDFLIPPGKSFNKGDELYKILNFNLFKDENTFNDCLHTQYAQESGIVINHNTSGALGEGQEVYQVIENYQKWS
jgi:uncharacterized protein